MIEAFITIGVFDILDILLVAFLMQQVYLLIRGTTALNVFIGILTFYVLWRLVKALDMQLLGSILGQVIGVGVIAIMIVFQQEIRRFLLIIGTRYMKDDRIYLENLIPANFKSHITKPNLNVKAVVEACSNMAEIRTGALIAITGKSDLKMYYRSGEVIDAQVSSELIKTIFFKNNPLHDGGMIIVDNRIQSARCVFPVSEKVDLPKYFGLRHRAALGISENTDAIVIVVSEESGQIAYFKSGMIKTKVKIDELEVLLKRDLNIEDL